MKQRGFCIFIDTLFDGPVPLVRGTSPDGDGNAPERICVFPTEQEAQHEIVDALMTRLQEFIDGERDFDDAITVEEYVVKVDVGPDGTIVIADDGAEFR